MFAAAVAVLATSCSKEFENAEPVLNNTDATISFSDFTENAVRAAGKTAFTDGDAFKVYGIKTVTGTNTDVFNGTTVTKNGAKWEYTPLKAWDQDASKYDFFAYYPASLNATYTTSANNGLFEFPAITFDGTTANDLMVAEPVTKDNSSFTTDYTVPLHFHHAASLVDVKVKKSTALKDAEVILKELSIKSVDNVGTPEVTGYADASPRKATVHWVKGTGTKDYANTETLPITLGETTYSEVIKDLVTLPHTLSTSAELVVKYTIGGEEFSRTVKLTDFCRTENDPSNPTPKFVSDWAQGTHYTYNLTINANLIVFTADVADWTENTDKGYYYIGE